MTTPARWLYDAAPAVLQNVMLSGYGLYLRFLRYGAPHDARLQALLESQWWDAERIRAWQVEQLIDLVRHAREEVPLYQALPADAIRTLDDLARLPQVSKGDVRRPRAQVVARAYRSSRLQEVHTGGTTGTPLVVHCSRETLQHNFAFFSRLKHWTGARTGCRTAVFGGRLLLPRTTAGPVYWRSNWAARTLLLSSYHLSRETVPLYSEALARFQPQLIDSYPSSLVPIARFLVEEGITAIQPRAIITSSETLQPEDRALFERAFACPVFDYYGGAEMAAFISQCERGTYHVNPEFGIVEVLVGERAAKPGEEGEIVATGFLNRVMPLIRYRTGDLAVPGDGPCPCGRAFPVVARVIGRLDDVIITPDGRHVGRLDPIFKAVSNVDETRIVQDAVDHVRVEFVPAPGFADRDGAALRRELQVRLGPEMRVDLVAVPALPRTARGKLQTVVRQIEER